MASMASIVMSYQPGLLPRSVGDQAILTGLTSAVNYGLVAVTGSAVEGAATAVAGIQGQAVRLQLRVEGQGVVEQWLRSGGIGQSIQLAGIFPMLAVYSYHAYNHYEKDGSMYIHRPDPELSTAENFLRMLRPDMKYTELEARVLDVALLLHAEHGGGNNSTFTTRVVTSSGTDTYSAMAAALCSLKGPRHGGANLMVMQMMQNIRENLHDTEDDEELEAYLKKLLHGEAFDRKGLIYGMGHAVYSLSDPREVVFKGYVEQLAHEKGRDKDLALYNKIEHMAPQLIAEERKIFKGVSPNVDFYSGFVYDMLGIPMELYTPLFAVARVMGWSAHRIEELLSANKIIRPAYKSLGGTHEYIRRNERE